MGESRGTRFAGLAFGLVFGFVLAWTGLVNPDVIREMLLLEDAYVYLMLATAVAVGFVGARVLRAAKTRALVTGERVDWKPERIQRHHVVGSAIFGLGWSLSQSCPGPIAAQLGQGMWWSVFTIAGTVIGVLAYLRRHARAEVRAKAPAAAASIAPEFALTGGGARPIAGVAVSQVSRGD